MKLVTENPSGIQMQFFVTFSSCEEQREESIDKPTTVNLHQIHVLPMSIEKFAIEIRNDEEIAHILKKLKNYENIKRPLVFVLKKFRNAVIHEFYIRHLGINKIKKA